MVDKNRHLESEQKKIQLISIETLLSLNASLPPNLSLFYDTSSKTSHVILQLHALHNPDLGGFQHALLCRIKSVCCQDRDRQTSATTVLNKYQDRGIGIGSMTATLGYGDNYVITQGTFGDCWFAINALSISFNILFDWDFTRSLTCSDDPGCKVLWWYREDCARIFQSWSASGMISL